MKAQVRKAPSRKWPAQPKHGHSVLRSIPVPVFGLLSTAPAGSPSVEWQFGGWLQSLPPMLAFAILAFAAALGLALIVFFYRCTLRELPRGPRVLLTTLRAVLLLALLLVLANPSRVEREAPNEAEGERNLAVVVDRSASMHATDNRRETRLSNAMRIWKQHSDEAVKGFDHVRYYRFGERLEEAQDMQDAVDAGNPAEETRLWAALRESLNRSPSAIVCLTDGLDTSGSDAGDLIADAQNRGVPLYFVAAQNRGRPAEQLHIRDLKAPSRVLRNSKFTASAVLEISTPRGREVPVELWSGEKRLASSTLQARAGWNVLPWSVEVASGEPGRMPLEFRLGTGELQQAAATTTRIADRTKINVLYYQGALQWGYRFLLSALQTDPSFRVTSLLNPALGVRISTGTPDAQLKDLPDTAAAFKRFDIIILAHVFADQLSTNQQQALIAYAKAGGGVLFISPDSEATRHFAGTMLEEMLPIVFERTGASAEERAAQAFEDRIRSTYEPQTEEDSAIQTSDRRRDQPQLLSFEIPAAATNVFKASRIKPMFANFARVRRPKPAAEVLAIHPSERTADDRPRVLLARQQFGS